MDCESFVLSIETENGIIDKKNLEDLIDFTNLNENHELFSNKKIVCEFKIETPKNVWIDEFVCLKSRAFSFKCSNKSTKNLKGNSKSYFEKF